MNEIDLALNKMTSMSTGPLAVLFACLILQKHYEKTFFSEKDIASIIKQSEKTVRADLRELAQIGFITRVERYGGWILTFMGRQMLVGVAQLDQPGYPGLPAVIDTTSELPGVTDHKLNTFEQSKSTSTFSTTTEIELSGPAGHKFDELSEGSGGECGNGKNYRSMPKNGENAPGTVNFTARNGESGNGNNYRSMPKNGENGPGTVNFTARNENNDVVVVNDINLINLKQQQQQVFNDSGTVNFTARMEEIEKIGKKLCQSAEDLLGDEIWGGKIITWLHGYEAKRSGSDWPGLQIIFSWIAQLSTEKPKNIRSSLAAIAAANILAGRMPSQKYLNTPWDYVPNSFLEQMWEVVDCVDCWHTPCVCDNREDSGVTK